MKELVYKLFIIAFVLFSSTNVHAQKSYTPYDELPAINILEKPAYSPHYPSWAKKLYQYPVNYYSICDEFDDWISSAPLRKSAIIRYFLNWKTGVEPYVSDDGTIVLPDTKKLFEKNRNTLLRSHRSIMSHSQNHSDWTFLGPKETVWKNNGNNPQKKGTQAPWQANVYSFDVAASNNDILYCGTETGFVNKTTDNGLTWQICGQDYHFGGGIPAIAINPSNPDIVYVAAGGQLHKSSDGGTTWRPVLKANNIFSANRLRIDYRNPEKIITSSAKGIFVSTNGGATWSNPWNKKTWDIEIKPDDSNIIYGITAGEDNIFKFVISKDGGKSFASDPAFPSDFVNKSGALIAVTPANPNIVYVSMLVKVEDDATTYLYKGIYDGNKWTWLRTKKGDLKSVAGLGGFSTGQGYYDFVFEASPSDENIVFWGTCSLFKSIDGGRNFNKIGGYGGHFSIHPDMQDLKLLPNGKIWVSTDGGISYSTDYFTNLENFHPRIKGLVGSHMWGFDQGWNEDIVVGGRYHNGNTAITDAYKNKALRMGGAEAPTGWVLKGKSHQAVFSDINRGATTTIPATIDELVKNKKHLFTKLPNMKGYGARRGNLLQHPNYRSILYVGQGTGFWKTYDSGASWDLLQNFSGDVMFMEISHKNPDVIYADIEGKGLYRSEDGGNTWTYKPSLTMTYGKRAWAGRIHFVISPYDENTLYVTPQKTSIHWEAKVLKSTDGGTSWTDWSGSIHSEDFSKCLVIQPTKTKEDLVYLFISSQRNIAGAIGKVYYRKSGMSDWERFDNNYPAGMTTIMALPFYRDSKIRVAGKGGIWESPMEEINFNPILNPSVDKPVNKCPLDTIQLDDYSMLRHAGAQWEWEITPAPQYISNPRIRNPKIVPGEVGSYNVKLTVDINGVKYSRSIKNLFTCTPCPSLEDCSNPAILDKRQWSLVFVDSEESDRKGTDAFDDNNESFWHTKWRHSKPNFPHQLQIDLGRNYNIHQIGIINRPTGTNGRIKDYEIYLSDTKSDWGTPVKSGTFENNLAPAPINFANPPSGRYLKLLALSEVNNNYFASLAELNITGCYANTTRIEDVKAVTRLHAFPVPASGEVMLPVPGSREIKFIITSSSGQIVRSGRMENVSSAYSFHIKSLEPGVYIIHMTDDNGIKYRAKIIKQ